MRKACLLLLFAALLIQGCKSGIIIEEDSTDPQEKEIKEPDEKPSEYSYYMYGIADIDVSVDDGKKVDSKKTEDYRPCSVKIDGGKTFESLEARGRIRGRGNSTWEWYPKKPYRIKLDESAPVLGMDANKDWVLMADYRDVTHLMNNVGFSMAHYLGLPCANHSRYARLTLNGEYLGLYMVTEQVEEGGHRVPLDGLQGILLALDINDGPGDVPHSTENFYSEVFRSAACVKYPENATTDVRDRVKTEFAKLERAIDGLEWDALQQMLDIPSMIHYIMIQELIANVEMDNGNSMRSGYIHRYSNSSKWVMGPLWDCDGGFSYNWGDMYDYSGWGHTYFESYKVLIYGSDPYKGKGAYGSGVSDFFSKLFGMPEFVKAFKQRWNEVKEGLLTEVLENIEATEEVIEEAADEDTAIWDIYNYDHSTEVEKLTRWLKNRFSYLDGVFNAYPENAGEAPVAKDIKVVSTITYDVSFPLDEHHAGDYVSISDEEQKTLLDGLGLKSLDELTAGYFEEEITFQAIEPDGKFNPENTAYAPGIWFDDKGYVTSYGSNSYVYSQLDLWGLTFEVGKHPTICTPGDYTIKEAFVKGENAVCFTFNISVTE